MKSHASKETEEPPKKKEKNWNVRKRFVKIDK
jgi:hypothetical protein